MTGDDGLLKIDAYASKISVELSWGSHSPKTKSGAKYARCRKEIFENYRMTVNSHHCIDQGEIAVRSGLPLN